MKFIKITFLLLIFVLGCDDRLEVKDPNRQTTADSPFWINETQALAGCDAIYNSLIIDGGYQRMTPALTDGRGDDMIADSPWLDLELVADFTIYTNSGPISWVWGAYYQMIWRANQVLDNVPAITMNDELKKRILGQAYFLRGLAYFNLANYYKIVPVVTTSAKGPEDYYPATATEEELWARIYADFEAAKDLLPVSYATVSGLDANQIGRATKGAATGFLGKAYLYRGEWTKAKAEFDEFFTGSLQDVYALADEYKHNFDMAHENNVESLFEVQFATPNEVGGSVVNWGGEPNANWRQVSAQAVTYAMEGKGFSDFLPTRWIYDEYKLEKTVDDKTDPRLLATIASYEPDDNSTLAYGQPWPHAEDRIFPRKYTNDGLGAAFEEAPPVSGINYRVLRYADILLMYAEVLNELDQTDAAYAYIQLVRDRANLPDLAVAKPGMTQEEMRDQLAHERALEFACESQRINDIIRWGWLYDADKLAELRSHDTEFNTWTPGNEYLPIPQGELDVNKNLVPNPAN